MTRDELHERAADVPDAEPSESTAQAETQAVPAETQAVPAEMHAASVPAGASPDESLGEAEAGFDEADAGDGSAESAVDEALLALTEPDFAAETDAHSYAPAADDDHDAYDDGFGADGRDADAGDAAGIQPPPLGLLKAPPTLARRTVAAEIARQLRVSGVRFCFTVPGEACLPLIDELAAADIRIVTTRHESGAAFMAEALAQATGRPQVVAVSRAVGASNAAIGIHTASQDSAPLLTLVGQVQRPFLGREAFQEADLVRSFGSLAAWAAQIDDPAQTPAIMAKVWKRLGSGRPGPILLSLPQDVQVAEIEVLDGPPPVPPSARGPAADRAMVSRVMKLLAASERGVIVAGGGVLRARASKRLVALSEALAVPVIAAWRRPDVFPNDHPNYLGMAGVWSAATVRPRLVDADVIVYIGTRLSEVNTYGYSIPGPRTRWAHVDVQPRGAHDGLGAPTIGVEADASRFLDAAWSDLRAAALDDDMRSRREARTMADREAFRAASQVGQGTWEGRGVHPGRIIDVLRSVLPDNAAITTDAGNMAGWVARGYRFRRAGTFLGPTSGAMGFGLPAAIAASLQDPDRIAIAICGDGGFAMTMMEVETSVREGAHPIVLVFDNERYGTTALGQAREARATTSSELGPIDFAALSRAQGALAFTVAEEAAFEPALRDAIASRQTSVIHLVLDRAWVSVDDNPVVADS